MIRLICLLISLVCISSASAAERTDFDGDGVSDLTYISIGSDSTLRWKYRGSKTLRSRNLATLGVAGNHITMAKWSGKTELGVIGKDLSTNNVTWTVRRSGGELTSFVWGTVNDLALSGGDFDGNGLSDAAAVEVRGNILVWKILLNPLGTPSQLEIPFGEKGDIPFYWVNASGPNLISLLRKNLDGTASVFYRNPMTGEQSGVALGAKVSPSERPLTILNGSLAYLLLTKKSASSTTVYLFRPSGSLFRKTTIRGGGDLVVGNYLKASTGEEIAVKNGRSFSVINPFSMKKADISLSAQVPVDDVNINTLGTWDGGGSSGGGGNGGSCVARTPRDGGGGFVWKPNSDTMRFAVAVLPPNLTGKTSKVEAYTSQGAFIKEIGYKGCGNPDGGIPRCNYQDRALTGSDYRRLYGSIVLKILLKDGSCVTYALDDPSRRID